MKTRMVMHNHGARIDTAANDEHEDATSIEWRRRVQAAEDVPQEYSVRGLLLCALGWGAVICKLIACYAFGGEE